MRTILLGAAAAVALASGAMAQNNQNSGAQGGPQQPPVMSNPGGAGGAGQRMQGDSAQPRAARPDAMRGGDAAQRQPMDGGAQQRPDGGRGQAAETRQPGKMERDGNGRAAENAGDQQRRNDGQSAGRDRNDRPAAAGNVGSRTRINITAPRQKTVIKNNIVRSNVVIPAGVTIAVGSVLPTTIAFQPVPAAIIAEIPSLEPYYYVVVDGEIVFVDPGTYEIVYVMPLA